VRKLACQGETRISKRPLSAITFGALILSSVPGAFSQEAKLRWEMKNQIRRDKFDIILPRAMRENGIDMWIIVQKEGHLDPLYLELGQGYVTAPVGLIILTDLGKDRVERAVFDELAEV